MSQEAEPTESVRARDNVDSGESIVRSFIHCRGRRGLIDSRGGAVAGVVVASGPVARAVYTRPVGFKNLSGNMDGPRAVVQRIIIGNPPLSIS